MQVQVLAAVIAPQGHLLAHPQGQAQAQALRALERGLGLGHMKPAHKGAVVRVNPHLASRHLDSLRLGKAHSRVAVNPLWDKAHKVVASRHWDRVIKVAVNHH